MPTSGTANLPSTVGPFRFVQLSEDRRFVVVGHFEVIEVEPLVKGLVEVPLDVVWRGPVERLWVFQQVKGISKHCCPDRQLLAGAAQAGFGAFTVDPQVVQFGPDLGLRHGAVGGQIDQPRFAFVDGLQAAAQAGMLLAGAALFVAERFLQQGANLNGEVGGQLQRGIVLDDRFLDQLCPQVRQVADTVLATTAQEVGVTGAVPPDGFGVDEARGSSSAVATLAEQSTLEVALKNSISLTAGASHVQHVLHLVEQLLADDRFVATGVDVALVDNESGVIGVAEHGVQFRAGDGPLSGPTSGWASRETQIGHRDGS